MNVKELKLLIADLPDTLDVFIRQNDPEFVNSMAENAEIKSISFRDGSLYATDTVLIISDEI